MNAVGVRAFYGCTDVETAVAEARTPVGGTAIVGKFEFINPVEILDLRIVDEDFKTGISWFDPDLEDTVSYRNFVHELHALIRRPVLPDDEQIDYLPTQMVAEYLASKGFAGALFRSALLGDNTHEDKDGPDGLNIILFASNSVIRDEMSPAKREITDITEWSASDEDEDSEVHVTYRTRQMTKTRPQHMSGAYPRFGDAIEPTLRLRKRDIISVRVAAIKYRVKRQKVVLKQECEESVDY